MPGEPAPVKRTGEGRKPPALDRDTGQRRPPLLSPTEVRRLLCSIDKTTATGLHDLALLGVMIHCFVRAGGQRGQGPAWMPYPGGALSQRAADLGPLLSRGGDVANRFFHEWCSVSPCDCNS
jgi:hypothetical protein